MKYGTQEIKLQVEKKRSYKIFSSIMKGYKLKIYIFEGWIDDVMYRYISRNLMATNRVSFVDRIRCQFTVIMVFSNKQ